MGALTGAAAGSVLGGVTGALERLSIGDSDFEIPSDQNTGEYFKSQNELDQFIDNRIGNVNEIETNFNTDVSLASENNLPNSSYIFKDNLMYKPDQNGVLQLKGGSTKASGGWFSSLKSHIYISPGIKGLYYSGVNVSQLAINHEILHAFHLTLGISNADYNRYSERATSAYSLIYSKAYNMNTLIPFFRSAVGDYPGIFSWRNLFGKLNLGIRYEYSIV